MKKLILPLVCGMMLATSCGDSKDKNEGKGSEKTSIAKDTAWKSLSLREKIGQTMMVTSNMPEQLKIGGGSIEKFLEKYPVGGMFIAQWFLVKPDTTPVEKFVPYIVKEYNKYSKYPLFICEDFERGAGYGYNTATKMPVEMTLGAANDAQLAYEWGKILATESKSLGFNWVLSPVTDLNINPLHPLVIERSISDDADRALPLLQQQVNGIIDQNVITTIKHFPGDGATIGDQHLITTANNLSIEEWNKTYGRIFNSFIGDNTPSIMVGHLRFPAYQKADTLDGMLLPSTLSKEIMQGLLKGELNYKGVVISDALNMGGGYGYYESELETAVQCFIAGADIVLWPDIAYMDTVEARINRGEIPMERLDDAVERVWALRERFNLIDKENRSPIQEDAPAGFKAHTDSVLTSLAEKAVTIVKDKHNKLPLDTSKVKKVMLANISHSNYTETFQVMKKELEARGFDVTVEHKLHKWDWDAKWDELLAYDKIIVCFENHFFDPVGSPLLKGTEAMCLWTINALPKDKIIGVSFSNPYYNTFYLSKLHTLINAYSSDEYMQKAVVKVLTGENQATATSPVILDNPLLY